MGGAIGVDSEAGKGALFWFTIKCSKPSVHLEKSDLSDKKEVEHLMHGIADKKNFKILLAEDNKVNQVITIAVLRKIGFEHIAVCGSGAEVIKILEKSVFDIVLMDIQMPEMDGIQATAIIRDVKSGVLRHSVPVIAMTANAMVEDRDNCIKAGMNDYISKPISDSSVAFVLDKWLPHVCDSKRGAGIPAGSHDVETIFDYEDLYSRLSGDIDLIMEIIKIFINDMPRHFAVLKKCIDEHDMARGQRTAHTMKGAASNVGLVKFMSVAFEVEKYCENGNFEKAGILTEELERQFDMARNVLNAKMALSDITA